MKTLDGGDCGADPEIIPYRVFRWPFADLDFLTAMFIINANETVPPSSNRISSESLICRNNLDRHPT
jgi:hypothetical protein